MHAWAASDADQNGSAVVVLEGELDLAAADELEVRLIAAVRRAKTDVRVDVSKVTFLDSSGMRALIRALQSAHHEGKGLRVVGANGLGRRVFDIAGVSSMFGITDDVM